ncbi:Zinc finger protein 446 [Sciurus carolinensis]|uniref:Zinc finger protein 446 n=1 Tax=Sciurus carolinensis TaxID=30640 RepID=A0AA41MV00_SCICA|nr:Zinc finger protein 446 [Sciurus carolinensis]
MRKVPSGSRVRGGRVPGRGGGRQGWGALLRQRGVRGSYGELASREQSADALLCFRGSRETWSWGSRWCLRPASPGQRAGGASGCARRHFREVTSGPGAAAETGAWFSRKICSFPSRYGAQTPTSEGLGRTSLTAPRSPLVVPKRPSKTRMPSPLGSPHRPLSNPETTLEEPEAARLRFRGFCYKEVAGPREALTRLRELCRRWLRPESCSKEQMLELLVLEQFVGTLPAEIQAWVQGQRPGSPEEAAALVEGLQHDPGQLLGWEEWGLLHPSQKELYWDAMLEKYGTVVSLAGLPPPRAEERAESKSEPSLEPELGTPHSGPEVGESRSPGEHSLSLPGVGAEVAAPGHSQVCTSPPPGLPCTPAQPKPYVCQQCGRGFDWKSVFVIHHRSHTGGPCPERPPQAPREPVARPPRRLLGPRSYTCEECGRSFSWKSQLVIHRKSHAGQRRHFCSDCGRSFDWKSQLVIHRKSHRPEAP